LFLDLGIAALVFCAAHAASAQSVSLSLMWDANPEPDVAGYHLHYGTAPGSYTEVMDVGNSTTATVSNLPGGSIYFFAATAYNAAGVESVPSNEVSSAPTPAPSPTATPQITVSPAGVNFTAVAGNAAPPPQSIQVTTSNGGPWNSFDTSPWFNSGPTGGASGTLTTLIPNIQGLAAGTYSQTITFSAAGLPDKVVAVTLTLTASPNPTPVPTPATTPTSTPAPTPTPNYTATPTSTPAPTSTPTHTATPSPSPTPTPIRFISVSPDSINFTATVGGADPAPQSIQVTTSNGKSWRNASNSSWFDARPTRGASGTSTIVTPHLQGLVAGTYSRTVTFSATGLPNKVVVVNLTLTASRSGPAGLANVSTRVFIQTGDDVMIGGFIVAGDVPKSVILRAIGPSLAAFGVSGAMADPALRLYDSTGAVIASNDNWRSDQSQTIEATGLAPIDDREAALVTTLPPGAYTAVVNDENNNPGVALFEFYDLDPASSQLANLSTRGKVETADSVMIGGFMLGGDQPTRIIVRAIGPSLTQVGVPDALVDPMLELHDGDGALVAQNDNWRSDQEQQILDSALAPSDDRESAIIATLNPGPYSAIVRGAGNSTGVALFEIYKLTP